MIIFKDNRFDLLPKNPVPVLPSITQPEMICSPAAMGEPPTSDPGDGGGKKSDWITLAIVTISIVTIISVVVYFEERNSKKLYPKN